MRRQRVDISPAVAFVDVEAVDGNGELVAVALSHGYSFPEAERWAFGFFRTRAQAEMAPRAGGFIGSGISGEDLTDAELLVAWER